MVVHATFCVEVKCFSNLAEHIRDLYIAIGQYIVYQAMLDELNNPTPLYLAVPKTAYDRLFDGVIQRAIIVDVTDPDYPGAYSVAIMMMAHIEGDYIVIDADNTDRPLYEGLMQAGIPREKIIFAYAGERVPTSES